MAVFKENFEKKQEKKLKMDLLWKMEKWILTYYRYILYKETS